MHAALIALCLALWSHLAPGLERQGDARAVAEAIATAVERDGANAPVTGSHAEDAALLAYYAALESGLHVHPRAWSWDARAGVSVGPWQLRAPLATGRTLAEQAASWLALARAGGIAGVDSSPSRAERRGRRARALLAGAL